jgi:hypothetical protein
VLDRYRALQVLLAAAEASDEYGSLTAMLRDAPLPSQHE